MKSHLKICYEVLAAQGYWKTIRLLTKETKLVLLERRKPNLPHSSPFGTLHTSPQRCCYCWKHSEEAFFKMEFSLAVVADIMSSLV